MPPTTWEYEGPIPYRHGGNYNAPFHQTLLGVYAQSGTPLMYTLHLWER